MFDVLSNKLLFMMGVLVGLLIAFTVCCLNTNNQIWQVDLARIISKYSKQAAHSEFPNNEIATDFKARLNAVIDILPKKVILISRGGLLSGQTITDRTEWFLVQMELNNAK